MRLGLYWSYATRSLIRSGQRTVLAIFCIAVGVMAIVALQLVGLSINQALTSNIVQANGGDIRLTSSFIPLQAKNLTIFQQLQSSGKITAYTSIEARGGLVTLPDSSVVNFSLFGVQPNFPLVGTADFTQPSGNVTFANTLTGNNVIVDSSTFDALHAHLGQTFQVTTDDGRVLNLTIAAEFKTGGYFNTSEMYISQQALDAAPLPNGQPASVTYSTVLMTVPAGQSAAVKQDLQAVPIFAAATITTAQDQLTARQSQVDQFRLFLQIVGLLALFIGGIGIINTMQVLLRRRRVEIAMLKTSGYRQYDLYALFGLEAALLGLLGGVVGAAAGLGVSGIVRTVMSNAFFVQLPVILDWKTIFSGLLIGLATALIFGLLPIVQASQIRPLSVLRESEEGRGRSSVFITAGLLALLSVLFVFLAASIMGNFGTAIAAVYGGAGVIFALGVGFGLLVLAISRLPVYERPSARILLWVLLGLGVVVGALLVSGVLSGIGFGLAAVTNLLNVASGFGTYASIVTTGLSLVLIGGALVFFLATIVDAVVMLLPRGAKVAVMLAYRNMGRQQIRTTTTLTALFVGVFAIGLVVILGQGIENSINSALSTLLSFNVVIATTPDQASNVRNVLVNAPGVNQSKTHENYLTSDTPVQINGQSLGTALANLNPNIYENGKQIGRIGVLVATTSITGYNPTAATDPNHITGLVLAPTNAGRDLTAADAGTDNVLEPSVLQLPPLSLAVGDTVTVQSNDANITGTTTLTIVGFYDSNNVNNNVLGGGIIGTNALALAIGGPRGTTDGFTLKVDTGQIANLRHALHTQVPSAQVISLGDLTAIINTVLNNLILMLTTLASLAMIAGLIIIANAVALSMLERRREIGILKSVGHTSSSILATVLVENGLVGLLGSFVAMLLVGGAITALSTLVFHTSLGLGPALIALIIGATTLVTMLIAGLVAWTATRVRPLEVLRYE